jgi:flagellar protein FlgJ
MAPGIQPTSATTSALSLEQIERNPHIPESEKTAEAARQFEAILLRQILAAARKTVIKSDLESESTVTDIYQDLVNQQLAEAISQSETFGLARSLRSELTRQTNQPSSR